MVIFDRLSYKRFISLRKKFEENNIECKQISELNPDERIDSAVCLFSLSMHFFDIDAFEFLKYQKIFKGLDIVLALERGVLSDKLENANIAVSFAHALVSPRRKNYKVIAEVDRNDESYLFDLIDNKINPKPQLERKKLDIYTDGACSGNPGCGGWAAVVIDGKDVIELSGGEYNTTNNRMEIMAAIRALEYVKTPSDVEIFSDSAYLVNAFELGWLEQWKRNRWKNSDKVLVKNIDLWQKLDALTQFHNAKFSKVKGHANVEYNNRCDKLAVAETRKLLETIEK